MGDNARRMVGLRRNLIANSVGTLFFGAVTVAMVPVYVRLLGVEAFGLIAFQTTLAGIVALFDAGLGVTTNRELARLSVTAGGDEARVYVRTTEVSYWAIAAFVGVVLQVLTPWIATRWIHVERMNVELATQAVALAVLAAVFQFPYAFYSAGLLGLHRHVPLNTILCAGTALRALGSVVLLLGVARDVRLLFAWHAAASLAQTIAAAVALHRALPPGRARFDRSVLSRALRFARPLAVTTVLAAIATQVDKLAVSKLLPLETFGFYSIAWMIAAAVAMAVTPVQLTVFPRLSQLVASGDEAEVSRVYHRASQVVAALLLPLTAVATLFSHEIVLVWTRNAELARAAQWVAVLLVTGAMLNALSHISYAYQLAHGWTAPALIANAVQLAIMIPLTYFAVRAYGALGAAAVWAALQASFLIISLAVTHSRGLRGEAGIVLLHDVGPAVVASFAVAALARWIFHPGSTMGIVGVLLLVGGAVLAAGALSTAVVRDWLRARVAA